MLHVAAEEQGDVADALHRLGAAGLTQRLNDPALLVPPGSANADFDQFVAQQGGVEFPGHGGREAGIPNQHHGFQTMAQAT